MQELDYDHTWHEKQYGGDDKLLVYFFMEVLPDEEASRLEGRPKFRDAEMIHIQVPGAKSNIVIREVRDEDKERFEKKYEAFKKGIVDEQIEGFPLKEWTALSRSMVEELKYLGFRTVDQLANASDSVMGKFPGLRELSARAKTYLAAQKSDAPLQALEAANKTAAEQIKALEAQVAELIAASKKK